MTNTPLEDRVHDALHRRVDPVQRAPLTVGDVRTRARRIQRRRTIAAGAAVAAVLAVAVPVGLTITTNDPRSDVPPATQPAPSVTGPVRIDPRSASIGDPTRISLVDVDVPSVTVDAETTDLPETYDQVVPYLDGWIAISNVEGALTYQQLDPDFAVLDRVSPVSPLTVSADRARIAFAEYDGDHWSVIDLDAAGARQERWTSFPSGPEDAAVRTVGFLPGDDLLVARTAPSTGEESAVVVTPDGTTRPLPGFIKPVAASPSSGLVAGQTSSSDDGSCWAAVDATVDRGAVAWETCDHSLGEFSTDGQHLAGFAPYLDGNGSPTLSILDAATGEPVVDFAVTPIRNQVVGINPEVVWEDDATLIATVVSGDQQYVVRLGLDGTVERLEGTATVEPGAVAIRLMP